MNENIQIYTNNSLDYQVVASMCEY